MKHSTWETDPKYEEDVKYTKEIYNTLKNSAYILGTDSPSDVIDWVDTGSTLVNLIVSNRSDGGFPVGRIVSLAGDSGSGKSLIVAHLLANTQKKGGIAVLVESEAAVSPEFMQAIGVDLDKLIYVQSDTVEEAFNIIEKIIEKVRKDSPNRLLTICLDSLTALSTKVEKAEDYDPKGYGTEKAKLTSKAFRKITVTIAKMRALFVFTNQIRMSLDTSLFDPEVIPGGKAIEFYPSVIMKMKQRAKIKANRDGVEEIIGVFAGINITKNRMGPPFRKCNIPIYFDRGINDNESIFKELVEKKYVFIPKDASTCCIDFKYIQQNAPAEFLEKYTDEKINSLYEKAKTLSIFKKYAIPDTKKDKLAMIDFNGTTSLFFSKENWEQFYSVEEFKDFFIDYLSVKMQLKYMRHGMDESSIKIDDTKEDIKENVS